MIKLLQFAALCAAAILMSSCALTPRYGGLPEKRGYTTTEKVQECTYRLIERNGVEAEKAQRTCERIYRRK